MNDYKEINVNDYKNLSSKEGKYKVIGYHSNGNIEYERYYINNKYHREDGPAFIEYYTNGNIRYEEYYINDQSFLKEDYYSPKIRAILDIAKMIDTCEQRFNFIGLSLRKELNE